MTQTDARKIDLQYLKWHYLMGMTLQEIANRENITRQRAGQRIQRAVKWVKSL